MCALYQGREGVCVGCFKGSRGVGEEGRWGVGESEVCSSCCSIQSCHFRSECDYHVQQRRRTHILRHGEMRRMNNRQYRGIVGKQSNEGKWDLPLPPNSLKGQETISNDT